MRKVFWIIIIFVLIVGSGVQLLRKMMEEPSLSLSQIQQEQGIPVEVMEVQPETFTSILSVSGMVGSEEEAYLSSKTGGRIAKIHKDIGVLVHKDELLAQIDTSQLEIQRAQAEKQVNIAENDLKQKTARFEDAERDLQRMKNLFERQAISKRELEKFELDFTTAKQQYESAISQLEVAKDNLDIIETNIRDSSVFAPFDGIVGVKEAKEGEVVSPGQLVLSLYNLKKLNVQVEIAENDLPSIGVGQRAELTLDALPSQKLTGYVTKISGAPDPNTKLFDVHIAFEEVLPSIKPGMFLRGRIFAKEKEGVLVIPQQSLVKKGGKEFVFVVKNDKAQMREVQLGEKLEQKVEIISGIRKSERVITFGKENVKEGSLVKIIEN